jgi:predicted O-methyltransferase YrrM
MRPSDHVLLALVKLRTRVRPRARLRARRDSRQPDLANAWGGPFNGQEARKQIVSEVAGVMQPTAVIETGSYRGTTTAFLRDLGAPVYTVELNAQLYFYVSRRFRRDERVEVAHGDSREYLEKLAQRSNVPKARVLFYLDAHWEDDLPVQEELEMIRTVWRESVVMVDDFEVPDDPAYGFDDYGPGRTLSVSCLPIEDLGYRIFWPSTPGEEETGERRGCVVLATPDEAAERISTLTSLRPQNVRDD